MKEEGQFNFYLSPNNIYFGIEDKDNSPCFPIYPNSFPMADNIAITISDPVVVQFYADRPHLNIVDMNLIFIDIMKQLSTNLDAKIGEAINSQILHTVNEIKGEVQHLSTSLQLKLHDIKREYVDDIKLIISNTELTLQEKMASISEKHHSSIVEKTASIIRECVPRQHETHSNLIQQCIKTHSDRILLDVERVIAHQQRDSSSATQLDQTEKLLNGMFQSLQQTIYNTNQTSESRINANMLQINDKLSVQKQIHETLSGELNSFLNKYRNNSSVKGSVSEVELYYMIQKLAPTDEIVRCSSDTACCDIKLTRKDKTLPTILFESKDYVASVNSEEVAKFERDLQTQKCHGIFISQNSPITFKENYHIDVIGGLIHVYVSDAKYDVEKLKVAIHIVDHLSQRLAPESGGENETTAVSKDDFDQLKEEYMRFANQKNEMIESVKLFSKQLTERLDDIKLPALRKITGNNEVNKVGILCDICNNWWGKNQMSVSAHKKACSKKQHAST